MAMLFIKLYRRGRLGKRIVEIMAEKIIPTMATIINVRETAGKLLDKTVLLKLFPPRMIGSQPITPIISELVAQEWKP